MGRPAIPASLKKPNVKEYIVQAMADYCQLADMHDTLVEEFGVKIDIQELTHFCELEAQQNAAEVRRRKIVEKLPIFSGDWCLKKLNDIVTHENVSPSEVLAAIRTRNALLKDGGVSDQEFIDSIVGDDDPSLERAEKAGTDAE